MNQLLTIQQALKAPKSKRNTFGKFNYRSCEDILEALKAPLMQVECYVVITDGIELIGDRYYLKATASLKKDGKVIESANGYARESLEKKGMDAAQLTGSVSSYARKYALNGLFAIDDNQDPDADASGGESSVGAEAVITQDQFKALYPFCVNKLDNGSLEWSAIGSHLMTKYKIDNINELLASKFEQAMKDAQAMKEMS